MNKNFVMALALLATGVLTAGSAGAQGGCTTVGTSRADCREYDANAGHQMIFGVAAMGQNSSEVFAIGTQTQLIFKNQQMAAACDAASSGGCSQFMLNTWGTTTPQQVETTPVVLPTGIPSITAQQVGNTVDSYGYSGGSGGGTDCRNDDGTICTDGQQKKGY